MATRLVRKDGWTLRRTPRAGVRRQAALSAPPLIPSAFLQSEAVRVDDTLAAAPSVAARRTAPPDLVLDVDLKPGEAALIALRHPSGALTFHASTQQPPPPARGAARGTRAAARFRVPLRRAHGGGRGQRGLVEQTVRVAVLKIAKGALDKAVSVALPVLAAEWEKRAWRAKGLREGWHRVAIAGGGLQLTPAVPAPGDERSLLFLHGTFSDAALTFGALAATDFFTRVAPLYGDRIYAFNHFSVSRSPDENAKQLLEDLPGEGCLFDAVTHSRGGLVLRSLVEHRRQHGALADRFRLGHAILVAAPNEGTPLATGDRWEQTVGWFANLLEVLPDNPFVTGAEFVSESLVWLAAHLTGDLPGVRAMDGAGDLVASLQSPPGPPAGAYSALVANFHPDDALWQRAIDIGVDSFFAAANDLVVPAEGGWRVDRDGTPYIPAARIGCFGAGGNIDTGNIEPVTHVGFFSRPETAGFIATALAGEPQALPPIDPNVPLPDRRFTRAAGRSGASLARAAAAESRPAAPPTMPTPSGWPTLTDDIDTFHIIVMNQAEDPEGRGNGPGRRSSKFARVLASYGGARVTSMLRLRSDRGEPRTLFGDIIRFHERIKGYTNREQGSLPTDDEMVNFGGQLFETLFQGDVRRLYDEARSRQRGHKLDLVLTSMIPWIGEKPWEFAYDTGRRSFLATEEIHFVRNVLTNVPADPIQQSDGPLRMLVASAQPVGFGRLSIAQELEVVRRGFDPLIEAGLVTVDVLPRATPAKIHGYLSTGRYSIVHFIGHGVFDEAKQEGCLIFEDDRGGEFALGERSVREIFCGRGLSLVFLNACQSGAGGRADFNKGTAQALVSHGLPALVANQYSVLDSSATSFAQHFYWALGQGMTLGAAAREARIAVNYSMHGELIDWAVPVLYARDANRTLCARPEQAVRVPSTAVQIRSRRATTGRPVRIAVWDIDDVFPALARTIDAMNAAQSVYGFELVDMSVPLDIWDLESVPGTPYLWAERLARRLQSRTVELRVNLLACVTRHWMRDDNWLNLYGWWPDQRTPPVAIFSAAGIDMKAEGPDTDRAIANAMVTALAGFFGGANTHDRGPKSCPLFTNAAREVKYIVARQTFDAGCRRRLHRKLKDQLPALDALLQVFR